MQKKTIVLGEHNVAGQKRVYVVKRLVNSISYSIGETLTPIDVDGLLRLSNAWIVKVESSGK